MWDDFSSGYKQAYEEGGFAQAAGQGRCGHRQAGVGNIGHKGGLARQ